jgi:hypothetical protein
MLKKTITGASVQVTFDLYLGGSVLAGTVTGGATAVHTHLTVDSPESEADITRIIRLAKQGCFAEQMIQKATPIIGTYVINGREATIDVPAAPLPD